VKARWVKVLRANADGFARRIMRGESLNAIWLALILAVPGVGCSGAPSPSSGLHSGDATRRPDTGVVLSLTDIHFDPFYDPILFPELVRSAPAEWTRIFENSQVTGYGQYGKDSNYNLFVSALRHAARAAPEAEIILLAGDWLAHGFADSYYEHAGNRDPQGLYEFIDKTIAFITQRIREQFPYTAIYPALGNEDSYCGDYQLQPGGEFLRRTADTWKALFEDGDNERAFMRTFPRGGYYTVSAPGTQKHRVIVLNTVFFSASYSNRCGDPKDDPAGEEVHWLAAQLKDAAAKEERVWLLYHIPPGIDAFGTAAATSGNTVVPFWQAGYLESFLELLDQYRDTIVFTLAGHTHADDFRLALDSWTSHSSFLVVTPSISPVFGNNPGLQVLSYDRKTFSVLDYATHRLNLAPAPLQHWQEEYRFSRAYRFFPIIGSALETLFRSLQKDAQTRATYIRYYNVSNTANPAITDQTWPIYWCAIGHLRVAAFEACRQGFSQP
jgi:sphingomyelin phosphodiesterase acid-like 3